MIFTSSLFLFLFLPVFLALFHALPFRLRTPWLLASSWVFYAWWRVDFLALLLAISTAAWLLGRWIGSAGRERRARARAILAAGVTLCIATLAYFKYAGFGVASLNALLTGFGAGALPGVQVILPVGISFSLFKAIAYMVDVYRGTVPAAGGWLDVAAYVAIFPQVISGPIDRYGDLVPQLHKDARSLAGFSSGAMRFMQGFCKKVLVADVIASLADSAFALTRPSLADAWLGTCAYTMQIYFDFSGYTDMAVGLGKMMGLRFMENFRQPYLSGSISEFWKRWHISLSSWLRDYLYISLGGNRRGLARTCANLMIVMVLGGMWHGAALTFAVWGAWHGILLVAERLRGHASRARKIPRPIAVALTMVLVSVGWVLFRSPSLPGAARMYAGMIGLNGAGLSAEFRWQVGSLAVAVLAIAVAGVYLGPWIVRRWQRAASLAVFAVLPLFLLAVLKVVAESSPAFLYGKF